MESGLLESHSESMCTYSARMNTGHWDESMLEGCFHTQQGSRDVHILRKEEDMIIKDGLRVGGNKQKLHNQDAHIHSIYSQEVHILGTDYP